MYSKDESKRIKKEFWTRFGWFSQKKRRALGLDKKWISHYTGINCLSLKFDFEKKKALVGIEISSSSKTEEEKYYNKLLALKGLLNEMFDKTPQWDTDYELSNGKYVIKIYHFLDNVNIYNKDCWPEVFVFFFDYMLMYESFYLEYKEFIVGEE